MEFVIQFVGIIMFVTLTAGSGDVVAYRVLMPEEDNVCGQNLKNTDHDHQVFVRVHKDLVHDDTGWIGAATDCLGGQPCKLYPLNDAIIEISNTVNTELVSGTLTALHMEKDFHPGAKLKAGLEDKDMTNAQLWITTGKLVGKTLQNKMRATNWKLESGPTKKITITAKPRKGGTPAVLVLDLTKVNPLPPIQIVNTTMAMAKEKLGEVSGTDDPHFFIYYRMTDPEPASNCKKPTIASLASPWKTVHLVSTRTAMHAMQEDEGEGGASIACSNTQWP